MIRDQIVDEIHGFREKTALKYNYDADKFFQDVIKRQNKHRNRLVSYIKIFPNKSLNPSPKTSADV